MKLFHFQTDFIGRPPRPMLRGKTWYTRQRIGGKDVWRSLHTTDKKEAEYLAVEIWRMRQTPQMRSIIPVPPKKISLIWATYANTERFKNLAVSTQETKARAWLMFAKWCESRKIKYTEQLTKQLAIEYLQSGNRKNKTYNNLLNDFRQAFEYGGAESNIFAEIEPLPIHRGAEDKRSTQFKAFTDEEMQRVFYAISNFNLKNAQEWLAAAKIASMTGLRYKDIALLKSESIKHDENGEYLELAPAKTENKTGGKVVYIRIVPELSEILKDCCKSGESSGYILPNLAKAYLRNWKGATNPFQRLCHKLGINGSFHSFRVTVVTKAAKAGINLEDFGGVVGHSSKKQTQAYNRAALNIDMNKVLAVKLE